MRRGEKRRKEGLTEHEAHQPAHEVEDTGHQVPGEREDGLHGAEEGVEQAAEDGEDAADEVGEGLREGGHGFCVGCGVRFGVDFVVQGGGEGGKWAFFVLFVCCR